MRFLVTLPFLCYVAAMVLSFLCLFAGHKKGFMEDHTIVRLNTSSLGYNLVDNVFTFGNDSNTDDDDHGLLHGLVDGAKNILD